MILNEGTFIENCPNEKRSGFPRLLSETFAGINGRNHYFLSEGALDIGLMHAVADIQVCAGMNPMKMT